MYYVHLILFNDCWELLSFLEIIQCVNIYAFLADKKQVIVFSKTIDNKYWNVQYKIYLKLNENSIWWLCSVLEKYWIGVGHVFNKALNATAYGFHDLFLFC